MLNDNHHNGFPVLAAASDGSLGASMDDRCAASCQPFLWRINIAKIEMVMLAQHLIQCPRKHKQEQQTDAPGPRAKVQRQH